MTDHIPVTICTAAGCAVLRLNSVGADHCATRSGRARRRRGCSTVASGICVVTCGPRRVRRRPARHHQARRKSHDTPQPNHSGVFHVHSSLSRLLSLTWAPRSAPAHPVISVLPLTPLPRRAPLSLWSPPPGRQAPGRPCPRCHPLACRVVWAHEARPLQCRDY